MRKAKIKVKLKCPFCGRTVDIADNDAGSYIRENKYLQKATQYYHKTCYQKFYSCGEVEYDRTKKFTKPD